MENQRLNKGLKNLKHALKSYINENASLFDDETKIVFRNFNKEIFKKLKSLKKKN